MPPKKNVKKKTSARKARRPAAAKPRRRAAATSTRAGTRRAAAGSKSRAAAGRKKTTAAAGKKRAAGGKRGAAAARKPRSAAARKVKSPAVRKPDRLEELFLLRNQWRGLMRKAISLVEGRKLKWEINRQGKMRWYLHPGITHTSLRSLLVFMQEIPPGSRSGRQLHQGGVVHYVLKGRGYTVVNGQRHDWEAGDTISLPILPDGIEYQHFNTDADNSAVFIAAEANLVDPLGADLGSGLEQLENCPEYKG